MASNINPIASQGGDTQSSATKNTTSTEPVSKDMFLKLLVAQIKYQNPLNPADGVQFLSQLAEFSNLEQMVAIREGVEGIRGTLDVQPGTPAADGTADTSEA